LAEFNNRLLSSSGLTLPVEKGDVHHVYHQYVVRSPKRDALKIYLEKLGVPVQVHYPMPIHLQPAYIGRLGKKGSFPESEKASREILSLPLHQHLPEEYVLWVDEQISKWVAQSGSS
jgi:dTDP-4-amino-4,6-dideoxygalactose transaminase